MSLPVIPGYKLASVENWCTAGTRSMGIVDAPEQNGKEKVLASTKGGTLDDTDNLWKSTMDVSAKSVANTPYYARFQSNGYNAHLICHYEKVSDY